MQDSVKGNPVANAHPWRPLMGEGQDGDEVHVVSSYTH